MSDTNKTPEELIDASRARELTKDRMHYILKQAENEPGVTSVSIAEDLELTTMATGQIANGMVKMGALHLVKDGNRRTYYDGALSQVDLDKVIKKVEAAKKAEAAEKPAE